MKYTLWLQEAHELWCIEAELLPVRPRDYTDLIYVSCDRWDQRRPPCVQFSPDEVFMKKKRGINTSQVVVIHGFDEHGNATRQWFVRVRFDMLPTEREREHADGMIWPVGSAVVKVSQERWRNDPNFASSSLLTTNAPTENVMSMEKMSDLGYATRYANVPPELGTILALTADWGMQHHPSIKPMLDGELRRQEAERLEDERWMLAWGTDKEGGPRCRHWMTEPPGSQRYGAASAPRWPWRKTLGLPRDLQFEDALNSDMAHHLWTTIARVEMRRGRNFRRHIRVRHCTFTCSLLALRVVCRASNQTVDPIMERVMWNLFCAYKRAVGTKTLQHLGELAAACYQTGICPMSLKAEVDAGVLELERAWVLARTVGARAAVEPERVEVPTSTMRPALRHMYMRLACCMPPGTRCPPRGKRLPAGAPLVRPLDEPVGEPSPDVNAARRPLGTKVVRIRSTVAEGTQGIAWQLVVLSPAEARAASIAAKEWMKRDAEWVPAVRLKLAPRANSGRALRGRHKPVV